MINHINEIIVGEQNGGGSVNNSKSKSSGETTEAENSPTWINEIFQVTFKFPQLVNCCSFVDLLLQGILTSETRCLNCETVTSKDEEFCDLSIDVDQVKLEIGDCIVMLTADHVSEHERDQLSPQLLVHGDPVLG